MTQPKHTSNNVVILDSSPETSIDESPEPSTKKGKWSKSSTTEVFNGDSRRDMNDVVGTLDGSDGNNHSSSSDKSTTESNKFQFDDVQKGAIEAAFHGKNVFITGVAGE